MEYLKVNGTEYSAHFCGKQIDRDWDGRASKTVTLAMPYAQAVQLFVDGLRWGIVRREADADDAAQEQDCSGYCVAGPITDNRDGTLSIKMGSYTQLEQALRKVPQFTRILGNDRMFMPLERDEMAWLSAFTERKRRVIGMSSGVIEGDEIVILEGPLMNRTGWIRKIDRRKRVAYLEMRMFGRTLQTKVGLGIVRKTPKRE